MTGGSNNHVAVGDFNRDGALDIVVTDYTNFTKGIILNTTSSVTVPATLSISLLTQATSLSALSSIDTCRDTLTAQLGSVGAQQSRLKSALSYATVARENYMAGYARITDVDYAEESAKLIKLQILQQAEIAILAQANMSPNIVLALLK